MNELTEEKLIKEFAARKTAEHKAWDILAKLMETESEGNKAMDTNIVTKMAWALQKAKDTK